MAWLVGWLVAVFFFFFFFFFFFLRGVGGGGGGGVLLCSEAWLVAVFCGVVGCCVPGRGRWLCSVA